MSRENHQPGCWPVSTTRPPDAGVDPDLAGRPGADPVLGEQRDRGVDGGRVEERDHADAAVQGRLEVRLAHRADPADQVEDRLRASRCPRSMVASSSTGSTRARLAASPPPVTCDIAWVPVSSRQLQAGLGVDPGRLEELLAQRAARARARRGPAPSPPVSQQHVAHQRVAVGVQPARLHGEYDVARAAPAPGRAGRRPRRRRWWRRPRRTRRAPAGRGARRSRRRSARSRPRRRPRRCP